MANDFVSQYNSLAEFTFGLCEKFLVLCPENIWTEKFGGFPVCDQFYHALVASCMMIGSIKGEKAENPVPEAGDLGAESKVQPTTEDAKNFLLNIKAAYAKTISQLDDADLLKKNGSMCQKMGRDFTVAETLELMALHMQYHLGACDAALRAMGLAAAF